MEGFKSPLSVLGYSSTPVTGADGRGRGPLPLSMGVVPVTGADGRGLGPLPLSMGVVPVVGTDGRGLGPLPLSMGVSPYVPPAPSAGSKLRFGPFTVYGPEIDNFDDRDFMELLPIILKVIE